MHFYLKISPVITKNSLKLIEKVDLGPRIFYIVSVVLNYNNPFERFDIKFSRYSQLGYVIPY